MIRYIPFSPGHYCSSMWKIPKARFLGLTSPCNSHPVFPSVLDRSHFWGLTSYCSHNRYYLLKMDYLLLDFYPQALCLSSLVLLDCHPLPTSLSNIQNTSILQGLRSNITSSRKPLLIQAVELITPTFTSNYFNPIWPYTALLWRHKVKNMVHSLTSKKYNYAHRQINVTMWQYKKSLFCWEIWGSHARLLNNGWRLQGILPDGQGGRIF